MAASLAHRGPTIPHVADEIRALAERHWNGEADLVHAHHPVTPALDGAAEEIAPGVLTMISIASVNAIDTGDGLAMLDTGGPFDSDHVYDEVRRWRAGGAGARRRLQPPPHRPRLRHPPVRRRGRASGAGRRPVVYAHEELPRPLPPLRADARAGTRRSTSASSPSRSTGSPGRPTTATPTSPTATT